jgi:L,D-peptidoglycan transpeptidase YkuD (ErfK/YbiS/YcfS/YnhG family)
MLNKLETYELAISTTSIGTQGIFNATEVNILDKSRRPKLPSIVKSNSSYIQKPNTSGILELDDARPKSSWNNFLKSKFYAGNFSRPSTISTALLETIKKRIDQQVNE